MCGGWWPAMGGWMWVWPAMVVIGLVVVGVLAYGLLRGDRNSAPVRAGARQILDERYARGEIDAEEYRARVDGLR